MKPKNKFLLSYKKKRVLITGTTGFKGAWLSFWLNMLGAKVVGIALKPEKNSILFNTLKLEKKIKQYYFNINEYKKLNLIIKKEKPDIIFHLAAQSIVSESFDDPLTTMKTNIIGSVNILESFRINNIPNLVYITSDKCYLNLDKSQSYRETDRLGGIDNYSSSKASAELVFSSYFHSYFKKDKYLRLASTRAGNVIGGGDMKSNRIIPDIIKSFRKKTNLALRNPNATRPWQHVLEPLSGYLLLGHNLINKKLKTNLLPSWNFGPNLVNCKNVKHITKLVVGRLKSRSLKINIKRDKRFHEAKLLSLNIHKAKKELNWRPRLNLKQTINLTIDWYKSYFDNKDMVSFTKDQIKLFLKN